MSIPNEGFIQVATDGAGKRLRNVTRYEQQPDGTNVPVYEEVVQVAGPNGDPFDFGGAFGDISDALDRLTELMSTAFGIDPPTILNDPLVAIPSVWGASGLPPKAEPWQPVRQFGDRFGRQVMLPVTTRDLVVTQTTTISASTAETAILTGQPGVFLDPVLIIVSNTSAATNTRIDFRDKTTGTILFSLQSVGGAAPVGFALGGIPIPQTAAGESWTAQCATSTTDIRIYVVAVKNK